jgi:hypothetical protein
MRNPALAGQRSHGPLDALLRWVLVMTVLEPTAPFRLLSADEVAQSPVVLYFQGGA